jgi:hypothetical protein
MPGGEATGSGSLPNLLLCPELPYWREVDDIEVAHGVRHARISRRTNNCTEVTTAM